MTEEITVKTCIPEGVPGTVAMPDPQPMLNIVAKSVRVIVVPRRKRRRECAPNGRQSKMKPTKMPAPPANGSFFRETVVAVVVMDNVVLPSPVTAVGEKEHCVSVATGG